MAIERIDPLPDLVDDFAADYADTFRADTAGVPGATARDWAHSSLHGSEAAGGLFGRVVWHGILRFDLERPGTPGTAFGWRVTTEQDGFYLLDTDGPIAAGRMAFALGNVDDHGGIAWTTMLRFHRPIARGIWAVAGHAHRALGPRCLASATAFLGRPGPAC